MRLYGMHPRSAGWRKSSFCAARDCAEISRQQNGIVALRNSRRPTKVLRYTADEWQAFVKGIKAGEFDELG